MELTGVIQSGAGKGAFFTQIEWVVRQCENKLGFKPFPGTLNIHVMETDRNKLDKLFERTDAELIPDDPQFCAARVRKVSINGVSGAVVLPSEDVRIHSADVIEVIAACALKETLGLADGDTVKLAWNEV
jgi:CTP-dependent riboflavin kinase